MRLISILSLSISAILFSSFSGCDTEPIIPEQDILYTVEEDIGLEYMREEEKLARDVYITLFGMHDNIVFNLSSS
jgi:hypothetical protein